MGSTRYVKAARVTFWDLQQAFSIAGAIGAVEVDHVCGTLTITHEAPDAVMERQACQVEDKEMVVGKLLSFGTDGEFIVADDENVVHYCWPRLTSR